MQAPFSPFFFGGGGVGGSLKLEVYSYPNLAASNEFKANPCWTLRRQWRSMSLSLLQTGICRGLRIYNNVSSSVKLSSSPSVLRYHIPCISGLQSVDLKINRKRKQGIIKLKAFAGEGAPQPPLDLTEDNVRQVLEDARLELAQIFDTSVGITGVVELAELDGPFVKISLKGRFWHKRSDVLARLANYLKQRIPVSATKFHIYGFRI